MKVADSGMTAAVEFAIEEGTLELGSITRKVWRRSPVPLPTTVHVEPGLQTELTLQEFARPWRAFRTTKKPLPAHEDNEPSPEVDDSPRSKDEPLSRGKGSERVDNILRHYDPHPTSVTPLFPHELHAPSCFRDVTAVDGSIAFKVSCKVVFNIGAIEPVTCRLALYDLNSGGRTSEEFVFQVNPPLSAAKDARFIKSAMFYVLPTHYAQNLYLVLQTSKVLQGDAEIASLHYCQPEKFMSEAEQAKLIDKAAECAARLGGSIHQPLAWGAVSLSEGIRQMILYRQKASLSDDARLAMLVDASKGTLKEKTVPCICELDIEKVDDVTVRSAKKRTLEMKISPTATALLYLVDPMFHAVATDALPHTLQWCREMQPFCPPQAAATWGPCASGPVAVSYIHALYLYPHAIDRFQHRNVAVKVQLVHDTTEIACFLSSSASVAALTTDVYCHVSYHQKSPSFEDEIKILLPLTLDPAHHVVFTFYQVHCKKMAAGKLPMDIVGRAVLPVMDRQNGVAIPDATHTLVVTDGGGGVVSTATGANNGAALGGAPLFQVRSRLLSTVYSQDSAIQSFLHLWTQTDTISHEELVARIVALKAAPSIGVRHHALRLFRQLLAYLCHAHRPVRTAAFATCLTLFDKCSMSSSAVPSATSGSAARKHHHDGSGGGSIVLQYIDAIFDEPDNATPSSGASHDTTDGGGDRRFKVYEAVIAEWTALVTEATPSAVIPTGRSSSTSTTTQPNEPRRLAMTHANVLLHLVLKSIALSVLSSSPSTQDPPPRLPQPMVDVDLVASLLDVLLDASLLTDDGFIARKDMLQSLGRFALALFWVVKSPVPALWIQRAVPRLATTNDSAVMIHMTFPFLRILADADAFVEINTIIGPLAAVGSSSRRRSHHAPSKDDGTKNNRRLDDAWLAQLVVTTLLQVATDQSEEKIKSQAMAILRRLLVVQMSGAKSSQKERVAMMLLPVVPNMLALTRRFDGDDSAVSSSQSSLSDSLKRDVLLCIIATLQHVPERQLKGFWKPKALLSTATYERHHHTDDGTDWQNAALQAHVLGAIQTLRYVMDTFLGAEVPWQQVLSPDCADQSKPPQLSLLDIEVYMKQRNNRRSQLTDEATTLSPRNNTGAMGNGAGLPGSASGSGTQPPGGSGSSAHHRSLPRNWGKHYMAQRKNSMDVKPDDGSSSSSSSADHDMDGHAKRVATAVAHTLVATIQTLVHEFSRSLGAHPAFLATVVDLWYALLTRIGHGHFDAEDVVVSSVLTHLTAFLGRFQTPLFAHSNVVLMADDAWCERLVVLAASGASTAPLAATFVCDLLATSFDQRGHFLRVQHALVQVVAKQLHLPLLTNVLDAMDAFPGVQTPFRPRLTSLVASLRRVVTTWQQYEAAMTTWPSNGATMGQVESLTDALVSVAMAIPPEEVGLFDVHVKFIDALARVHVQCGQFAEAAKCKLHLVDMATTRGGGNNNHGRSRGGRVVSTDEFVLVQYKLALTYLSPQHGNVVASSVTSWAMPDMALAIAQDMLAVCHKVQNYVEYATTLKIMDSVVAGVLAQQRGKPDDDAPPVSRYFLVAIVGSASTNVPDLGIEFIYKRSAFCHVSEMMASIESGLNASFPHLKVKPISMAKLDASTDPDTVYVKATPVEPMFVGDCGRAFIIVNIAMNYTMSTHVYEMCINMMQRRHVKL
ncbi:hypothetical protein, variant 1 [Aphanomyces astaci]|uniref:C2 DOCK-type domain-containing protein n=1 Tax=Aphanomyces astaci TaxID=112090 RepID=W4FPH0_APHAT|nr:hypothetical protein, variant 1 [Aphanomyces astaci]ETV69392.1 hypothetical protein, variant 1 [Aphanomyces astaci]|eukprot:XP_009841249.1 hypothetical protein, variant 1 [Aphanomyces astaci]